MTMIKQNLKRFLVLMISPVVASITNIIFYYCPFINISVYGLEFMEIIKFFTAQFAVIYIALKTKLFTVKSPYECIKLGIFTFISIIMYFVSLIFVLGYLYSNIMNGFD